MYDYTIVVLNRAFASSVALTLDILASAALLATRAGQAPPRWRVVSAQGGAMTLSNGLQVPTTKLSTRGTVGADASVWVLPGMGMDNPALAVERLQQPDACAVAKALAQHSQQGGTVAASCSSVFLLQAAGILSGKTVTTSWWLAPYLRRLLSDGIVDAQRILIADGNVITAGAALAQTDLMLYLLRTHSGSAIAEAVSRVMLIDGRTAQAQYVIPAVLASGDTLITQLSAHIEAALPHVPSVSQLAEAMCMSERTLARHVMSATGLPPLMLIQHVRLARARTLLERSRTPVEQVAEKVGYSDASALRRLLKKHMGATPRQLRAAVETGVKPVA